MFGKAYRGVEDDGLHRAMPTAKLHITLPEDLWISAASSAHPEAEFRVLAAFPAGETGVGLLEITASDLPAIVGAMEDREDVVRLDLQRASEESALVEFETTAPLLLFSVRESGLPLELPFAIRAGVAEAELTASRDRLSAFTAQLDAFGMQFDVEYVREMVDSERLLTQRQRELLHAAVDEGYYDTPRGCSLTELAEEAGVAKSTASETLHRAEEKIVKEYVEG